MEDAATAERDGTLDPRERGEGRGGAGTEEQLAVVVPVSERPHDLADLYREFSGALRDEGMEHEFVFVAEPYHHDLLEELEPLRTVGEPIRLVRSGQVVGEATLLKMAAEETGAPIILTLPPYYRVEAEALPRLVRAVKGEADLALARRHPRHDSWINRLQTRVFHWILGRLAGGDLSDIACGVRAMRREVLDNVPLYGDFFRFFPVLAQREGYRVVEIDAPQHARDGETRVYAPGIYLRRAIDLLGVVFLTRFTWKPLRFFGLVGSGFALVGGAILAVLFVQRIGGEGIADRPLLLLGVLLVTLGVQAVALGLVGEIVVHLNAPDRRRYRTREAEESAGSEDG